MAMHSSSVRVRPAIGARSVAGGGAACAGARSVENRTRRHARETLGRENRFIRPLRISRRWTGGGWPVYTFFLVIVSLTNQNRATGGARGISATQYSVDATARSWRERRHGGTARSGE